MDRHFLTIAHQGKHHWWRYFLGIALTLFFFLILGHIAIIAFAISFCNISYNDIFHSEGTSDKLQELLDSPSIGGYLAGNMEYLVGIVGLFLAIICLHQRNLASLVRVNSKIQWRRILMGTLVWTAICFGESIIDYLIKPHDYVWSFKPIWWLMAPMALSITPIQTSFEELFFRGYLMQGMALLIRNRLALVIINGIIFMIPHLENPEMQRGNILALDYLITGVMLAVIAIRDNGLELSLGIHAAHNLQVLFFNAEDSALPFPALWYNQTSSSPIVDVIITSLEYALFYYIFFGKQPGSRLKSR
jgi:uncharacterized protein